MATLINDTETGGHTDVSRQRSATEWRATCDATPEEIDTSFELLRTWTKQFRFRTGFVILPSIIESVRWTPTTLIDTVAVTVDSHRMFLGLYNPKFVLAIAAEPNVWKYQGAGIMAHEGLHLLEDHVNLMALSSFSGPAFTLATETRNNRCFEWIPELAKQGGLIKDGKPFGIYPRTEYDRYHADLTAQGKTPVSYQDMFDKSLEVTYREFRKMTNEGAAAASQSTCEHGSGSGSSKPNEAGGAPAPHPDGLKDAMSGVFQRAVDAARNGDEAAKRELIAMGESYSDNDEMSSWLGGLGLGALRGEGVTVRNGRNLERATAQFVAKRTQNSDRRVRSKRTVGGNHYVRTGDRAIRRVFTFADTSGSMSTEQISRIQELFEQDDQIEATLWSFDAKVYPWKDGERLAGGGATALEPILELIAEMEPDEHPDAVVIYTDGYVGHVNPDDYGLDADAFLFVITADGKDWPQDESCGCHPQMETVRIDELV
jgi:hypothetical protein